MGPPTDGEPGPPRHDAAPPDEVPSGGYEPTSPAPPWTTPPPTQQPGASLPQGWSVGPAGPVDAPASPAGASAPASLQIGSVLGRTLDQFVSHPLEFVSLAIPAGLITLLSVLIDVNRIGPSGQLALTIVTTVAGIVFSLAMIAASDDVRAGQPIDLGAAIATGLARTVTAILSGFAFFLVVLGLSLLVVVVAVILGLINVALAIVAVLAGFLVIAFIGIRWALADAAIVLDRRGPLAALNRSWSVSRGNVLRMVALYVLLGLLTLPIGVAISLLAITSPDVRIGGVLGAAVTLVTAPIAAIASTTVYGDLSGRPFDAAANPPRPAGRWLLAGTLIVLGGSGLVIAIPNIGKAYDRIISQSIPTADRGVILAGTSRGTPDPCRPAGVKESFSTAEQIWIGGYFTEPVVSGEMATIDVVKDGSVLASTPLTVDGATTCYYENSGVAGLPPGSYLIRVTANGRTVAQGGFIVH